jgi:hypothetical protein
MTVNEVERLRQQERNIAINIQLLTAKLREVQYRLLKLHTEERALDVQRKRVCGGLGI